MILENEFGKIEVNELGGEITSIFLNELNQDLLVKDNSWKRTAPWLFPIVGEINGGFFKHEGVNYKIPRHGFVRDKKWKLTKSKNYISAQYIHKKNNEYPHDFKLTVKYSLLIDELKIEIDIVAKDDVRYNLGWHPALNYKGDIKVPSTFIYQHSSNKLVGQKHNKNEVLKFNEIINNETYIYDSFNLNLEYGKKEVVIHWCDFNFVAVWTKDKDEFISIEPWAKNLDLLNATPDLRNKDLLNGNNKLTIDIFYKDITKKCFKNEWTII